MIELRRVPGWLWWAALLPRLVFFGFAALHPERCVFHDSEGYLALGENLLRHGVLSLGGPGWSAETFRTPGYPVFLAICSIFVDRPVLVAAFLQCLLGALTVVLCWGYFENLGGRRGAVFGTLFLAFDPVILFHTPMILTETLFSLMLVISILSLQESRGGIASATISGVLWGIAALVRPISVYLSLFLSGLWLPHRKAAAAFLIAAFVLPAAWTVRNQVETGYTVFSSVGGVSLLRYPAAGVESLRTGRSVGELEAEMRAKVDARYQQGYATDAEQSSAYGQEAMPILKAHPFLLAEYCAWGAVKLLAGTGLEMLVDWTGIGKPEPGAGDVRVKASGQGTRQLLRNHLWLIPLQLFYWGALAVLYVLSLIGLRRLWRRGCRAEALFLAGTCLYFLALSSSQGYYRYRIPMMPFLAASAAAAFRVPRVP